jgi:MATE family multidrug resistance protein
MEDYSDKEKGLILYKDSTQSSDNQESFLSDSFSSASEYTYSAATKSLILNGIPSTLYLVLSLASCLISLHFIGKLDDPYLLDGVGIANTIMTCTTYGIIISLNIGLMSLASQAFGAKDHRLIGLYYHRALVINTIVLGICFAILAFSKNLLLLFNMPEQTATYAHKMIIYQFGAQLAFMLFDTLKGWLVSQDKFIPQVVMLIFTTATHWVWCTIFVDYMGMDVEGVAIATTITYTLDAIFLYAYVLIFLKNNRSLFWFTKESFQNLWSQLKTEFHIGSMVYLEWIAYEISIVISATYPPVVMAAQVTFYNLVAVLYYFPLGISTTLNAFAGNAVGEGNVNKVRKLIRAAFGINACLVVVTGAIAFMFNKEIFTFFTDDEAIIDVVSEIMMIYIYILPFDFMQCLYGSYIRAIGKERVASLCFIICFYFIGLPLAYMFGNVMGYEVRGLWFGLGIGIVCMNFCSALILSTTDLKKQSDEITSRMSNHKLSLVLPSDLKSSQL